MRLLVAGTFLVLTLAAAEKPAKKVAKPSPQTLTIPAGAVQTAPYWYRFTDRSGKVWIYRETPFGVVRFLEDAAPAAQGPISEGIEAFADGFAQRWVEGRRGIVSREQTGQKELDSLFRGGPWPERFDCMLRKRCQCGVSRFSDGFR